MSNLMRCKSIYSAIFLISLSILMVEITLTKIFSVTLWYHFSYFTVSLALFGVGFGGLLVYHFQEHFKVLVHENLYFLSMAQGLSIILGLKAALSYGLPNFLDTSHIISFLLFYLFCTAPFILGSMILSILFLNWPNRSGMIYGADLLGAAAGCIACIIAISYLTAPQVILVASLACTVAALLFGLPRVKIVPFLLLFITLILLFFSDSAFKVNQPKNYYSEDNTVLFQKWSPLSRITVYPQFLYGGANNTNPFGWGMSDTYKTTHQYKTLWIEQDASAGTPIVPFDGDYAKVDFLKYDITALPYYLKRDANVFILGVGGGRDVLTALIFNNKQITGVDIHPVIVDLIKNRYAQFTGNIYNNKYVNIVVAEGRSFLARSHSHFDIIQIPLIDSWAATVAGAFAMTENSLYTKEAFLNYINHLSPSGILSVSRFYFTPDNQTIKVAILARVALEQIGVKNIENNIVVIKNSSVKKRNTVATVLVKREPFTDSELKQIQQLADSLHFGMVYIPHGMHNESLFENALTTNNLNQLLDNYYYDIRPNSDNRPFFFQMFYFSKVMDILNGKEITGQVFNFYGVFVLFFLLITSTVLVLLFYIVPSCFSKNKGQLSISWGAYFIFLGLGFMFIEIPFIQQGAVYLTSPVYGLSISLCGLLFFGGLGSMTTGRYEQTSLKYLLIISLVAVVVIATLLSCYFNWFLHYTEVQPWFLKVLFFILILAPTAFFMGVALPAGIRFAQERFTNNIPWFWALNGASSVLGSIIAMAASMMFGYNIALLLAALSYLFAILFGVTQLLRNEKKVVTR
ncbi:spermine/spermidine synthase domain-containing protein [Legionella fallonii]|uniref:Spermidine synthase-like protein n=1 Tax=Legionella fallonii LLAP-10 TaxID=1212491 RepID=A0A098FZS4_9GAMM|nr:hypothetical protein [Legionella fallonii]CEG55733.1 Spermidine synthase-like protein [Legionella fallonii LLAP-10]